MHLETGGSNDDVGIDFLASFYLDAVIGDLGDGTRHDVRVAIADGLEEISVRTDAETLFPWVILRVEVGVDGHRGATQFFFRTLAEDLSGNVGVGPAEFEEQERENEEFVAHDAACYPAGENPSNEVSCWVDCRLVDDICWGSLKHRYSVRCPGQDWKKRNGGGSAANDYNIFAGVVQILRPELRVNSCALEIFDPGDCGV